MLFRALRTQPFIDLGYFFRDLCKHLVYDVSHPWGQFISVFHYYRAVDLPAVASDQVDSLKPC